MLVLGCSRFADGVTSYRAWPRGPVTVLSASFGELWGAPVDKRQEQTL